MAGSPDEWPEVTAPVLLPAPDGEIVDGAELHPHPDGTITAEIRIPQVDTT